MPQCRVEHAVKSENCCRKKYKITRDIEHTGKKKIETPTNRYTHIQFDSVWKRLITLDAKHSLIARFINKNYSKDQIQQNIAISYVFY